MIDKVISRERAAEMIVDGSTIMIGGFMGCGNAHYVIEALVAREPKDLTLICNDAAKPGYGVGKLVEHRMIRRLIASHVGLNPMVAQQLHDGTLELELVPQGTLVERIRAFGAGLGGVLTPTGIGTPVEEGKRVIEIDGKKYLLETPLHADIALINGYNVDPYGNVWYKGTQRNFNYAMAMAATTVICEADHLVTPGTIPPEDVVTPGVFVDHIVQGGEL